MEPYPLSEPIAYVRQLESHLESALFEARRVNDDPEAAIVLVRSALAFGDRARARALVSRLERGAAGHPHAAGRAWAAAYCRELVDWEPGTALSSTSLSPTPSSGRPARVGRPVAGWDSLTETEARIADLVATGLTNRQVAREVFMSRHTVDTHLRHIFRKLAIVSRVQLARLVAERGPARGRALSGP